MTKDIHATITPAFSPACAWAAEGARVGLATCLRCGAAVLLDGRSQLDALQLHIDWHARLEATT